ncbi:hypothetical protein SEVIR_8G094100v4 [Setaria viridis]|uniref:Major facilitator superfamily (MFS) profile domain-containing protein n=1 Tax=Setaria viridis TaxID=4556 RepID=A0A4U6TDM5_SETVI|nr:polyol transporter 5-like [Setaria viridis]TKW00218.1 hypothetical protein SEVIR_8G094100v2 [Setaria viridis]
MANSEAVAESVDTKKSNVKYIATCAVHASMASLILGYGLGVLSGAALYIKKDLKITDVQLEVLMGVLSLYSVIGSFAAGRTSDWIGRRRTVILTAGIFLAAALLMAFSVNYAMLMAGQFVAGVGAGYAIMIPPVYAAEISPPSSRGLMSSLPEVFGCAGVLLGYLSNYAFARLPLYLGWRVMVGVNAVPSVLLAVLVLGMPESPRWLVLKGRLRDARVVLEKITETPEEAAGSLADIKAAAGLPEGVDGDVVTVPKRSGGEEWQVWKDLVFSPSPAMRRILLSALGIHFFQQASGIDAFVLYSPRIFMGAGITDDRRLLGITCALGVTRTLVTLGAMFLLDRVGRRPLLLVSTGGMAVALAGLAAALTITTDRLRPDAEARWANGLAVACTVAYNAAYSAGIGTVAWVYSSEIFPLRERALGCAIGVTFNRAVSGVVGMTFLSLSKAITIGGAFFLYASMTVIAWVFVFTCLPETRGRTLEEMGKLFGMGNTSNVEAQDRDEDCKAVEMPMAN